MKNMNNILQADIDRISRTFKNASESYIYFSNRGILNICDWFNNNWISAYSRMFAEEIKGILDDFFLAFKDSVYDLNNDMKSLINLHNKNPENIHIVYNGLSISLPNTTPLLKINEFLPGGSIGRAEGIDYRAIIDEIEKIKGMLDELYMTIKIAIIRCNVLDYSKIYDIVCVLNHAKRISNDRLSELEMIIKNKYDGFDEKVAKDFGDALDRDFFGTM